MLLSLPIRPLRIAILDDHPLIALGLTALLRRHSDIEIVFSETSADRFLNTLKLTPCDAAIIDYCLPESPYDGVNFLRRLRRAFPDIGVITLSAGKARDIEYPACRAGANACLSKSDAPELIADLIRAAVANSEHFYICRDGAALCHQPEDPDTLLSVSETEILRHIAQGLSVTQTAERLMRSKKTVSTHKRRAMHKLGLNHDLELALYLKERFEQESGAKT